MRLCLLLLLPPLALASDSASPGGGRIHGHGHGHGHRSLSGPRRPSTPEDLRPCGSIIGVHSKEVVRSISNSLLDATVDGAMKAIAADAIGNLFEYNIRSRKICTSCAEVMAMYAGNNEDDLSSMEGPEGFPMYCGTDKSGHLSPISGLLLEPINSTTGRPVVGRVKGSLWSRGTDTYSLSGPSEMWPEDIMDFVGTSEEPEEQVATLAMHLDIVGPLMAATAGTFAIAPDGAGYVVDHQGPFRYIQKRGSQMESMPLWLYAKKLVADESRGCTVLDDVASLGGYSAGGYRAVAASAALSALGVRVHQVSAGGGPYRISSTQARFMVAQADAGDLPRAAHGYMGLMGYSYSSTNPDLPNSDAGQDMLADERRSSIVEGLDGAMPIAEFVGSLPEDILSIFNQDFVELLRANSTNPCITHVEDGKTDKICQALIENDLTELLENVQYTVQLCHSPSDDIVTYDNLPNMSKNEDFLETQPSLMNPTGKHFEGSALTCVMASLFGFTNLGDPVEFSEVLPHDESANLPSDDMACLEEMGFFDPTAQPTAEPTGSPEESPSSAAPAALRGEVAAPVVALAASLASILSLVA